MAAETLPAAASADRLSEVLRRCGALENGLVSDVAVDSSRATVLSRITRLRLTCAGEVPGAPSTLILKTSLPERIGKPDWDGGRHEVAFYNDVAAAMPVGLVPRCFEAKWEADTRAWYLLLEDLTDSRLIATTWPLPPSVAQCEKIVRAKARFHAHWWDDPRFGTTVGTWRPADDRQFETLDGVVTRFFDRVGDLLPSHRRDLYRRLIDRGPELNNRYYSHRDMTVVQGDAHYWNCFLPKDGGCDVRFFDWDCWRVDVGTDDLAYMIALHWYPDRRKILERSLLDLYHATIAAHGVTRYDRRSLDADYRLSVLWQIATPVWQSNGNIPPVICWNNLERIMLAVDDLGCRDLLS